jgi:hypothetical protein
MNAGRQLREFLSNDLERCFDQESRSFQMLSLKACKDLSDLSSSLEFVIAAVTVRQAAQMGDQGIAFRQAICPYVVRDARSYDLLRTAAADAKEEFNRGPVNKGPGEGLKLPDYLVDFAVPSGFCGHVVFH